MSCGNCSCESCARWNAQMKMQSEARQYLQPQGHYGLAKKQHDDMLRARGLQQQALRVGDHAVRDEKSNEIAHLEAAVVGAAERLWLHCRDDGQSQSEQIEECLHLEAKYPKAVSDAFYAAVARYIQARSEDTRR